MASKIQIRRDTASNWTSADPTLSSGELGLETDTGKLKAGDGATAWTSLAYYTLGTTGVPSYSDAVANFTGNLQKSGVSVPAYGDTTSNFTGALQKSGVPVAADANLNSFIGAVDLPTADGTADQVLTTNGSGTLSFADASGGGGSTSFSAGSYYPIPLQTSADVSAGRVVSSSGYVQFWRTASNNNSNHTVGNTFTWISGNHNNPGSTQTSFAACGITVVPSTKTITVTTPNECWSNTSGFGISTWSGTGCEGGGEIICGGNIAWPGRSSYSFGYGRYRQDASDGRNVSTATSFTGDSHGYNEPRASLPYNSSGATRALVMGYATSLSSQAAYRTYSGAGPGSNGSISGVNACPNTNTSTCESDFMITHPLITAAGLFPNNTNGLPTHIGSYGTANGYSRMAVDAGNNVGGEVTAGFDRTKYSSLTSFLVKDPSSTSLKLFQYDTNMQICEWTSKTQTYDRGGQLGCPFQFNSTKYLVIPTDTLNEYCMLGYSTGGPYSSSQKMFYKFTIDYATGKFINIKVLDISTNTTMMPLNKSYTFAKALYGDTPDPSSAPTHILWTGYYNANNAAFALVTEYPANNLFTAI